jgi:hypothetical protein
MLIEDPDKASKLQEGDILLTPDEVADAMMQLCESAEYGNGTILEVSKGATRVVPMFNAPPPTGKGIFLKGWVDAEDKVVESLKKDGLQT